MGRREGKFLIFLIFEGSIGSINIGFILRYTFGFDACPGCNVVTAGNNLGDVKIGIQGEVNGYGFEVWKTL